MNSNDSYKVTIQSINITPVANQILFTLVSGAGTRLFSLRLDPEDPKNYNLAELAPDTYKPTALDSALEHTITRHIYERIFREAAATELFFTSIVEQSDLAIP